MRNTGKSIKAIVSTARANAAALIAPCSSSIVCVFVRTLQKDLSRTYALYKSDRSYLRSCSQQQGRLGLALLGKAEPRDSCAL